MSRRRLYQIPAELALAAVTLTAIFALDALFIDRSYGPPLILAAVTVHLVAALTRRLPGGLATSVACTGAALLVQLGLTHYRDTTVFGIPTGSTFSAARVDIAGSWDTFQSAVPPTPVSTGFVVVASVVLWLLIALADWAAFRLRSSVEALLPALAAFIFATIFDRQNGSTTAAIAFLAAAILFLLLQRAALRVSSGTWLGEQTSRSYASLLLAGGAIAVLAIVAGSFLGPRAPWADDPPTVDLEAMGIAEGPKKSREEFSPLVDIKGRLTDQPDVEMFTVRSPRPTYYRLTALNQFNGEAWVAKADYLDVTEILPREFPFTIPESDIDTISQQFNVTSLGMAWLPATFQPIAVSSADTDQINYEPQSSTLIVDQDFRNSNGFAYTVQSQVARFTPQNLQQGATAEIDRTYLDLPANFSPAAQQLAAEIVAGKPTRFEQARALQDYFRENFRYDLTVPKGHSNSAVEDFLEVRAGYCEQFSGTYAAMARSVGLASRVAIGFTHGIQDPDDPTLWHVRAEHAHAWPEVFIPGAGWVPFEPTPGRGAPGTEQYTGVATAQQESQTPVEAAPDPVGQGQQGQAQIPQEDFASGAEEPEDQVNPSDSTETVAEPDGGVPTRALSILVLLLGLPLLALAAVSLLKRSGLRRREHGWSRPDSPAARIAHVWEDVIDLTNVFGFSPAIGETVTEFADRAQTRLAPNEHGLIDFGNALTAADFGPVAADDQVATAIEDIAEQVSTGLTRRLSTSRRLKMELDPRPLLFRPSRRWNNVAPPGNTAQTPTDDRAAVGV